MSKKSFRPKLTENEALVLSQFVGGAWYSRGNDTREIFIAETLTNRGLLQPKYKTVTSPRGLTFEQIESVRITQRGELMLKRYQAEQAAKHWREVDRQERLAS